MKSAIYFVMLLFGSVVSDMAGECNLAGFYLELGCNPIMPADNSTSCPETFTCTDLHPDPKKCYYRGEAYGDRTMIPQSKIKSPCSQVCSCRVTDEPEIECAAVDCVETFDQDLNTQCIRTYDLNSCCSTGTVCGTDAIAKLSNCIVDGISYREGQSFEPKDTRKTCICTANWTGSYEDEANCKDIDCAVQLHYQAQIMDKCAPIFAGNNKGCPIGFQCPTNTTQIMPGLNIHSISSKCEFGNMTLSVGDEVTTEENCTKCSCEVPPFVSCVKANSC